MLTPDAIRQEVARIREQANRPFNLNFFCHTPPRPTRRATGSGSCCWGYYTELGVEPGARQGVARRPFDAEALRVVADCTPAVVSFHFGLPSDDLLRAVKAHVPTVLSSATTVEEPGGWRRTERTASSRKDWKRAAIEATSCRTT